jgi:hypothetical protein
MVNDQVAQVRHDVGPLPVLTRKRSSSKGMSLTQWMS